MTSHHATTAHIGSQSKPVTDDVRIREIKELVSPQQVAREYPAGVRAARTTYEARQAIHRILHGADDRLLVVIGPCSIHDPAAAMEPAREWVRTMAATCATVTARKSPRTAARRAVRTP